VNPLTLRFSGKPFICNYEWKPDRGARFHVVEKVSGRVVRTGWAPAFFAFHHVNAFEDGDDVVADIVTHPDAGVIDQIYLDRLRSAEPVTATGRLTRFRIGTQGTVAAEQLSDTLVELPRFDYDRRAGRRYRYVYGVGTTAAGDFADSLIKLDLERGTASSWHEEGCYPGEPVFAEKPGTVQEDGGVVLSVVLDTRRGASFLLVLDAASFQEVARAEAPHHIPFGFHGSFLIEGGADSATGGQTSTNE
jgi:carotenoid cleavage dioxygenase-like enzyme